MTHKLSFDKPFFVAERLRWLSQSPNKEMNKAKVVPMTRLREMTTITSILKMLTKYNDSG